MKRGVIGTHELVQRSSTGAHQEGICIVGARHGLSGVCAGTTRGGGIRRSESRTSDGHAWILGGFLGRGGEGYTGPGGVGIGRGHA